MDRKMKSSTELLKRDYRGSSSPKNSYRLSHELDSGGPLAGKMYRYFRANFRAI